MHPKILFILTTLTLYAQDMALSLESWQGVKAIVLRIRDVNVEVLAQAGAKLEIRGMEGNREWSHQVLQDQLVLEVLPQARPTPDFLTLMVVVKPEIEIQVFTTTGNIQVVGSHNARVFRSLRGNISLQNTRGQLKADSLTGYIEITNHRGDFYLQTVSGFIKFLGAEPQRQAQILSTNGNIFLRLNLPLDRLNLVASTLNPDFVVLGTKVTNRIRQGQGPVSLTVASSVGSIEIVGP